MQIIQTLDDLDQMLAKLDAAQKVSDDELRKLFPTFRMEFDKGVPVERVIVGVALRNEGSRQVIWHAPSCAVNGDCRLQPQGYRNAAKE